MGILVPSDEMPLQPQVLIEPFEKWALDFIGPINPPSKGKRYILVCTVVRYKMGGSQSITKNHRTNNS